MMIDEALLTGLGVNVAGGNEREIMAYCPVHNLVKGREASSPKWYMNRETGAWICFSCNQRGSLSYLVELLGADMEILEEVNVSVMKGKVARKDEDVVVEKKPSVYVSDYAFSKNPLPGSAICEYRDIKRDACEHFNVRWSKPGKCFLVPLYTIDGSILVGWQEKSRGYFQNVPDEVPKSHCLFGFQQYVRGEMIIMESPLDVVRLASYGIYGGVATMGSFVSAEQIEACVRVADDGIVLAFDDDEAGDIANASMAKVLDQRSVRYRQFRYPRKNRFGNSRAKFKDVGELPIEDITNGLKRASSFAGAKLRR